MYSGPRIQTGVEENDEVWWGAVVVLEFSQEDRGKTLKVSVDSNRNELSIELYRGGYDPKDISAWVRNRAEVIRTPRANNPTLTWNIEAGTFTLYFVDYVRLDHHIRYGPQDSYWAYRIYPVRDYDILYRVEVL